jgi:hypothetical protein
MRACVCSTGGVADSGYAASACASLSVLVVVCPSETDAASASVLVRQTVLVLVRRCLS